MDELLNRITEFCNDNFIIIAAGGSALLLLIFTGIFISNRVKSSPARQQRDYFLEGEYDDMLRDAAKENKRRQEDIAQEPAVETERDCERDSDEQAEIHYESGYAEKSEQSYEKEIADVTLEDLMAEEERQPVHININIERGQIKIGYDEDGKITCMVESDENAASCSPEKESKFIGGTEDAVENEIAEDMHSGIVLEKINLIKAAPVKKFGPGNFNTGRSGRIFTEEELREQIKD